MKIQSYTRALPDMMMIRGKAAELLKDASLPVPFVASTEGVKADGLDLKMDQWDLERYGRYGPILWVHNHWHPTLGHGVARAEDKLYIDVHFDEDDDFAQKIRRKAIRGEMAGSVGWRTYEAKDGKLNELLEFSMVPVGLDPDSLPDVQRQYIRAAFGLGETDEVDEAVKVWMDALREEVMNELKSTLAAYLEDGGRAGAATQTFELRVDTGPLDGLRDDLQAIVDKFYEEVASDEERAEEDEETGERAGAVLSKRNRSDLQQALDLIRTVLERATKEEAEEEEEGEPEEDVERVEDTPVDEAPEEEERSEEVPEGHSEEDTDTRDPGVGVDEPDILRQIRMELSKERV